MKTFKQCLQGERFVFTAELLLSDGDGPREIVQQAENFREVVCALQVAEYPSRRDQVSALAAATILVRHGIDAIPEFSNRDRNGIAVMSDLLGLRALGIGSIVVGAGNDGAQKPDTPARTSLGLVNTGLISMAESLNEDDSVGPGEEFLIGLRKHIDPSRMDVILADLAACSSAGARFLQIQPCFDMAVLRDFMQGLVEAQLTWNYAVMLSLAPLTSVEAVQRLREQQFGSIIPVSVSERLQSARKPRKEGIAICSELIREARNIPGVAGINLITMDNPQDVVESIRQSFD